MRLMIVDDNKQIREGIHYGIEWSRYGIHEVAEFADGLEAFKMMEAFQPDIVIADIRMPNMDGLTLLEKIRKQGNQCKYILLSAYSEFAYAQKAISIGADDYILKPIKPAKLVEVVTQNARMLQKEQKERQAYYDVYEKSMLHALTTGAEIEDAEKIKSVLARKYEFYLKDNQILLALLQVESSDGKSKLQSLHYSIVEKIKRHLKEDGVLFVLKENELLFLGKGNISRLMSVNLQHGLKQAIDVLNRQLKEEKLIITAGISESKTVSKMKDAYSQAKAALEWTYCNLRGTCEFYGQKGKCVEKFNDEEKQNLQESIIIPLQKGDIQGFKKALEALKKESRLRGAGRGEMTEFLRKLCIQLGRRAGMESDVAMERELFEESAHLECSIKVLEGYAVQRLLGVNGQQPANFSVMIRNISVYMDEHYKEPISVDSVAEVFERTPNYISSKFKKEVGKSFTDYLIELRIQKAISMLKYTTVPISEVAKEVGFSSYAYFSRTFRKCTGKNAGIYRGGSEKDEE